jgi:hypothetical protein
MHYQGRLKYKNRSCKIIFSGGCYNATVIENVIFKDGCCNATASENVFLGAVN